MDVRTELRLVRDVLKKCEAERDEARAERDRLKAALNELRPMVDAAADGTERVITERDRLKAALSEVVKWRRNSYRLGQAIDAASALLDGPREA